MATYYVTNDHRFQEVDDLEITGYFSQGAFHGEVTVNNTTSWGEFDPKDFEEEFGFIIINE